MCMGIHVTVLILSLTYSCTYPLSADKVTEYSEGFVQLASERFSPKSMKHINHLLAYSMPIKRPNYIGQFEHISLLYEKALHSCMGRNINMHETRKESYLGLCGMLHVFEKRFPRTAWFALKVFIGADIHVDILYFKLPWSKKGCKEHGMGIALKDNATKNIRNRYCGRRVPWYIIYRQADVYIAVYGSQIKMYLQYFVQYELPLIRKTFTPAKRHAGLFSRRSQLHFPTKEFKLLNQIIVYSPASEALNITFCFTVTRPKSEDRLLIFDGPGKYSMQVLSVNDSLCTPDAIISSGSMFTLYYYQEASSLLLLYKNIYTKLSSVMTIHHRGRHDLFSESKMFVNEKRVVKIFGSDDKGRANLDGDGKVYLRTLTPSLSINKVVFSGPNQLDPYGAGFCQYGGLFVYEYVDNIQKLHKEICFDGYQTAIPFIMTTESTWFVVILWYWGYTNGYVSSTVELTSCVSVVQDVGKPEQIESYLFPNDVDCMRLYISEDKNLKALNIGVGENDHLGPVNFTFKHHTYSKNQHTCRRVGFVECSEIDDGISIKHLSTFDSLHQSGISFDYPLYSQCKVELKSNSNETCPLVVTIERSLCADVDYLPLPLLLIGSENMCGGHFEIGQIPQLYLSSTNGSAYEVTFTYSTPSCAKHILVEIQDRRFQLFHNYVLFTDGDKKLLLTRAKIRMTGLGIDKKALPCDVYFTVGKTAITIQPKETIFANKWTPRRFDFVQKR